MPVDRITGDGDIAHIPCFNISQKLRKSDLVRGGAFNRALEQVEQRNEKKRHNGPEHEILEIGQSVRFLNSPAKNHWAPHPAILDWF